MRLSNSEGIMELTVLGYQFPQIHDDVDDSNWLRLCLEVQHPRGSWRVIDPILSTFDLVVIADWLEAVCRNVPVQSPLGFLEPNLAFALRETADGRDIRVYFELELRPPWAPSPEDDEDDEDDEGAVYIDFPFDAVQIHAAISSLREQLLRTPLRAWPRTNNSRAGEV